MELTENTIKSGLGSSLFTLILVLAVTSGVLFFGLVDTAVGDENGPNIQDEDGIDGGFFRADEVESKYYNFSITASDPGLNPGSIRIELSYGEDQEQLFKYPENIQPYDDDEGVYYLITDDDWTDHGFERSPKDGDDVLFNVSAEDEDNNINYEEFEIHIDGEPPYFKGYSPKDEYTNQTDQEISVEIQDDESGVDEDTINVSMYNHEDHYYLDGEGTDHGAITFQDSELLIQPSEDDISFSNEVIFVEVTVDDEVGYSNTTSWEFTVDTDAPEDLTLDFPEHQVDLMGHEELDLAYSYNETAGELPGSTDEVEIRLFDDEGNYSTYYIDDSDYPGDNRSKSVSLDLDNPDETNHEHGLKHNTEYSVEITARDEAGNTETETVEDLVFISNMRFERSYPDAYGYGDEVKVIIYDPSESTSSETRNEIEGETKLLTEEADTDKTIDLLERDSDSGVFEGHTNLDTKEENLTVLVEPGEGDDFEDSPELPVEKADKIELQYEGYDYDTEIIVDESPPEDLSIDIPDETIYRASQEQGNTEFKVNYSYYEEGGGLFLTNIVLSNETSYTFTRDFALVNNYVGDVIIGDVSNEHILDLNKSELPEGLYKIEVLIKDVGENMESTTEESLILIDNTPPVAETVDARGGVGEPVEEREVKINITDNHALTEDLDFQLNYNITNITSDGKEYLRSDVIEMENKTDYGEESVLFNASIDESDTDHGDEIVYWVTGEDLAGNPVDGGSIDDPLHSYYVDTESPQAPPTNEVDISSAECGVDLTWSHAFDCLVEGGNDICGSGIDKYMIFREGENIENVSHAGPTGYDARQEGADIQEQVYFDYVGFGDYEYEICSVDKMGNMNEDRSCTGIHETSSLLSEISFDYYHDFGEVYEDGDYILSNRTISAQVSDSCDENEAFRENVSEDGNIIDGEDVDIDLESSEYAYLDEELVNTDENGMYDFKLSAVLGGMEVDIVSSMDAPTERYEDEYGDVEYTHSFELEEHTVTLEDGWNLVSLPIVPDERDLDVVLEGVEDKIEAVWHYNSSNGNWSVYNPEKDENQLTEVKEDKGYWINANENVSFTVTGTLAEIQSAPPEEEGDLLPDKIGLQDGFNLIGFRRWMNITKYFDELGIEEVITYGKISDDEGIYYTKDNITDLELGKGYWAEVDEEVNVTAAELRELS